MGLNTIPLRKLDIIATIISIAVLFLVVLMRSVKIPTDIDFTFLPPFHATLNGITALVLLAALYFIKQRNIEAHRKSMLLAIGLSVLFLLSYVVYHFTTEETKFGGEGTIRYVYFFILITHVILAAVILPFILFTFNRAITNQFAKHKKLARWVYPIWLYVAITGPVCYFMLKPYYQ